MPSGPKPPPSDQSASPLMSPPKRYQSSDDEATRKRRRVDSAVAEAGPSQLKTRSRKKGKRKAKIQENGHATPSPIASTSKLPPESPTRTPSASPKPQSPSSPFRLVRLHVRDLEMDQDLHNTASMSPAPPAKGADNELQCELARLKRELATKNEILAQHQDMFSSLQGMLTCQICLELMWDPYTTSCGHIACVKCLQDWFRQPPAGDANAHPDHPIPPHLKPKTCPTCRALVRSRPTPLFAVRSILGAVSASLDPELVANQPKGMPGGPGAAPIDPWQGIFAKNDYVARGAVHRGVIIDQEDGVMRCSECFFEIVDGVCENCGMLFDEQDHLGAGDGDEDIDLPAWPFQPHGGSDDDDDDDGDSQATSESYEGSFIDDQNAAPLGPRVEIAIRAYARRPERALRRWDLDHDDEYESNSEDEEALDRIRERELYGEDDFVERRQDDRGSGSSDEESDEGSDVREVSPPPRVRRTNHHQPIVISDDSENDSDSSDNSGFAGCAHGLDQIMTVSTDDSERETVSTASPPARRNVRRPRPVYEEVEGSDED